LRSAFGEAASFVEGQEVEDDAGHGTAVAGIVLYGNLEECLANYEAFRSYMNPNYNDAIAKIVESALEERNSSEWKAFFIGGRWGVEVANMLSRQPSGYRDITKLCIRRTSVGSTNYVRVMYMPDADARDLRTKELSDRIAGRVVEKSSIPESVSEPPMYLLRSP